MPLPSATGYQQALAELYRTRLRCQSDMAAFDFSFAPTDPRVGAQVKVVRLPINPANEAPLWVTGTLGSGRGSHEHQFLGIYDSDSLELCEFLAGIYHFDLKVEPVGDGHTVPLGRSQNLRRMGYSSGLIVRGEYFTPFAEPVPALAGVATTLFAVLVITHQELDCKKQHGVPGLLDQWRRTNRDRFHIDTQVPS